MFFNNNAKTDKLVNRPATGLYEEEDNGGHSQALSITGLLPSLNEKSLYLQANANGQALLAQAILCLSKLPASRRASSVKANLL